MTPLAVRGGAAMAAVASVALLVRAALPYPRVFADNRVVFHETDAWIHVRQVESLLRHLPWPNFFDPYRLAPDGQAVPEAPLFDLLVAFAAWAVGLGAPSERLVETVAAFVPPALGVVVVGLVYGLGRMLFGPVEAVIAALLAALLPGQFLQRSLLGFTDHHVAEVLFATLVVLGVMRALRSPGGAGRPAVAAGVALAAYLWTWSSGALLVLVLVAWAVLQLALDHVRGRRTEVGRVLAIACVVGLGLWVPLYLANRRGALTLGLLVAGPVAVVALDRLGRAMTRRARPAWAYLTLIAALGLGAAAALLLAPSVGGEIAAYAERFRGLGPETVGEARPLLWPAGRFSLAPLWAEVTTCALLAAGGLALAVRDAVRHGAPEKTLLAVWTVGMLVATAAQWRFAYYLAINVALLAAWAAVRLIWPLVRPAVAAVLVLTVAVAPNVLPALTVSGRVAGGPDRDWFDALEWMRANTPEPFGDPDFYYARYRQPAPAPAWGVMAWWDYGYWITRIARRVPVANPTQAGAADAARFFTAQDEGTASRIMDDRRARYVISNTALLPYPASDLKGIFFAMGRWAGRRPAEFLEIYVERDPAGRRRPALVFYPAYYRAMAVRLHIFGGRAVVPRGSTWVIGWEEPRDAGPFKQLTFVWQFDTYAEADAFLREKPPGRFRIAGRDAGASCVPLEALRAYTPVYRTPAAPPTSTGWEPPRVAVFEYRPTAAPAQRGERVPGVRLSGAAGPDASGGFPAPGVPARPPPGASADARMSAVANHGSRNTRTSSGRAPAAARVGSARA
jgi:dolichyl-diphosphooligosaccharide--protein glycosyltransferase